MKNTFKVNDDFYMLFLRDIVDVEFCSIFYEQNLNTYSSSVLCDLIKVIKYNYIYILVNEYNEMLDCGKLKGKSRENLVKEFNDFITSKAYVEYLKNSFPIFYDRVHKIVNNYLRYIQEIIYNYEENSKQIENVFCKSFGNIVKLEGFQGDMHNFKTVVKVIFENGTLFYKPQVGSNCIIFEKIVMRICEYNKSQIRFKFPKCVLTRKGFWQEEIEFIKWKNSEDEIMFYKRCGLIMAVCYILNTNDFHYENIIYNGSFPVIIDFETISRALTSNTFKFMDSRFSAHNVYNTHLIPFRSREAYIKAQVNALFLTTNNTNMKMIEELVEIDGFKYRFKKSEVKIRSQNKCKSFLSANESINIFVRSFEDNLKAIHKNKYDLFIFCSELLNETPNYIRQILRPTFVYKYFIDNSRKYSIINSSKNYSEFFEALKDNFVANNKNRYSRVQDEIRILKLGNIPIFFSKTSDKNLYNARGDIVCENYFINTLVEEIKITLNLLSEDVIKYQAELIRMSEASIHNSSELLKNNYCLYDMNSTFDKNFAISQIIELMERINFLTIRLDNDRSNLFIPQFDEEGAYLGFINSGLYQGLGIVMFMCISSNVFNDAEKLNTSKEILNEHYRKFQNSLADKEKVNYSVFGGYGGLMYLLYTIFIITNNKKYLNNFRKILEAFIEKYDVVELKEEDCDYKNGIIGTLYMLLNIYSKHHDMIPFDKIENITKKVLVFLKQKYDKQEYGIAHGLSGDAILFAKFYMLSKKSIYKETAMKLIKKEDKLIFDNLENIEYAWCNGWSGLLQARALVKKHLGLKNDDFDKFEKNISYKKFFQITNLSLCHGIYGNISALHHLRKQNLFNYKFEKEQYFETRYFEKILDIKIMKNTNYTYETFMLGNTGIAYALLELYFDVPNVLTLEAI